MNYNEITNLVITKIEIKFYNNLYGVINSINNKLNINLKLFINLILLHICDNNIENINDIVYLVNLKKLHLINNKINIIPNIKNLINLKELDLSINQINIISDEIKNLINLKKLNLSSNQIIITQEIKNLTNLQELNLCNNLIQIIPEEIKYLTKLTFLNLSYNQIKIISEEIKYLINLKYLLLSNNQIKIIPNEIRYLSNLLELDLSNNLIITIPNVIIYCKHLRGFNYENNEIENISPIVNRFLNRLYNINELQIYNDKQNIHNHIIQESIFNSILNIINQNFIINNSEIINNIIHDTILTEKTKKLLIEYCEIKDIHSNIQLTFEELLGNVWILINILDTKDEIKSILNTEIIDSECKCFTGRISRLVNCLNGFTDLVKINISDNQQIGNIIIIIKEKLELKNNYTIEKHKELVINELKERNFNEEIIEEWIKFI